MLFGGEGDAHHEPWAIGESARRDGPVVRFHRSLDELQTDPRAIMTIVRLTNAWFELARGELCAHAWAVVGNANLDRPAAHAVEVDTNLGAWRCVDDGVPHQVVHRSRDRVGLDPDVFD